MSGQLPGRVAVSSIILGLVEAEIARQRGAGGIPLRTPAAAAQGAAALDEAGMGIDSLEQMGVRAAIEEMFETLVINQQDRDRTLAPATLLAWADAVIQSWSDQVPALVVATSGTTGRPKMCRHLVGDLMDEARYFAALVGPAKRVVALVPPHHIYGLIWTVLMPEILGAAVVRPGPADHVTVCEGDLVVAVPHQWQALSRRSQIPGGVVGVSAGSPLPPETVDDLRVIGLDRMIDVYGASETGAVGFREAPSPAYTLLPRWRFANDDLGSDKVVSLDARTTASLPDRIIRDGDTFLLDGRRDGAVQVGGINVWPTAIAALLCDHDGVAEAAVRLGANGRMKAFLVPRNERPTGDLVAAVSHHAAERLPLAARPTSYTIGASLPRGPLGKALDWQ